MTANQVLSTVTLLEDDLMSSYIPANQVLSTVTLLEGDLMRRGLQKAKKAKKIKQWSVRWTGGLCAKASERSVSCDQPKVRSRD